MNNYHDPQSEETRCQQIETSLSVTPNVKRVNDKGINHKNNKPIPRYEKIGIKRTIAVEAAFEGHVICL